MIPWICSWCHPEFDIYRVCRALRQVLITVTIVCCLFLVVYRSVASVGVTGVTHDVVTETAPKWATSVDRSVWNTKAFHKFLDSLSIAPPGHFRSKRHGVYEENPDYFYDRGELLNATISSHNISKDGITQNFTKHNITNRDQHVKVILLWNNLWKSKDFGVGALGREAFVRNKCRIDTCTLETDRSLLRRASAVVFHIRGKVNRFPKHANPRQLFVYFLRESPHFTYKNSWQHRGDFNITMTYRSDSDIPVPIFRYVPLDGPRKTVTPYKLKYPLATRNGSVAWLVSHCGTPNSRGTYAATLSKYIPLDIYGACGQFVCDAYCMKKFEREYKFYLSFENSYCSDYVTEKYHRALRHEIIPIVYGRANYTALGPPGAFINILDYRSPKHLASYLKYLSVNETAYVEYFKTKSSWKSVKVLGPAFCDLCELVHNQTFSKVYSDVHSWWVNGTCDMDTVRKVVNSTIIV